MPAEVVCLQGLNREQKVVLLIGGSLIILGVVFLVLQIAGVGKVAVWAPLLVGVIALILAILTRLPGFTFLGCLLLFGGAGLLCYVHTGDRFAAQVSQAVFLLFFSAGLCIVPVFTRIIDKKILLWPLFPGFAGLIGGVVLLL